MMSGGLDRELLWSVIDAYFKDNEQCLVCHHTESYNDFLNNGIYRVFRDNNENNPISIDSDLDEKTGRYRSTCKMFLGGKDGTKVYFGKPVIYDEGHAHYMFPNEARIRNMSYEMTIHYDIDIEFEDILEPGEEPSLVGGEFMKHMEAGNIEVVEGGDGERSVDTYYKSEKTVVDAPKTPTEEPGPEPRPDPANPLAKGGAPKKRSLKKERFSLSANTAADIKAIMEKSVSKDDIDDSRAIQRRSHTLERVYLGKLPIMVQSEFCILHGMTREARHSAGECRHDLGGYFIIDGKEKTIVPQEKFGDNMLYIRAAKDDKYTFSAEVRSVSENVAKPVRTLKVLIVAPSARYTNDNVVVNIPNVRDPIPMFIVFRALGVISDKSIVEMCLLDLDKYRDLLPLFVPSIHDAGGILTQSAALKYIATFTKGKTESYVLEILADYFLPHIGEINFVQKAYYLGYIVFRLLCVQMGLDKATDRDHLKFKRVELPGSLIADLFREYYTKQSKEISLAFEKTLFFNTNLYGNNLFGLVMENHREFFSQRSLNEGIRIAFKGNWGAYAHTKRIGVIQDLNRLSFNSALAHLRKTNLAMDASNKLVEPHYLHSSQWGFIDPMDTPDGGNVGLHKSLAIAAYVTLGVPRKQMIGWLRERINMRLVEECSPLELSRMTKLFVNGLWVGSVVPSVGETPADIVAKVRLYRRNALIPIHSSITFDTQLNTIFVYTDAGRVCRPVFYRDGAGLAIEEKRMVARLAKGTFTWKQLTTGFNAKKMAPAYSGFYALPELYDSTENETNPAKVERFLADKAAIDYIDPSESENTLIAFDLETFNSGETQYTHCEIHESLILGVMCNQIPFPENNQLPRNVFSCSQSKQACSMYHSNYQVRMDKSAIVLNYGQAPLVKSRYLQYINKEEMPYGENAIVAIMCYTGYNVEDAVLINEGALHRGLFRTTYYTSYEAREESRAISSTTPDTWLANIDDRGGVTGLKPGYDYSHLDAFGLIRQGTTVTDKTILIGMVTDSNSLDAKDRFVDASIGPKKGQVGVVDKTFVTEGAAGERIAKVRVMEQRVPNLGDKFASRNGQKGTVGMVVRECDMPFTKDGVRPDIIINPHAIPTRMTIGQLVECIVGKACLTHGSFGQSTAFDNRGSKNAIFGNLLLNEGFHSSGNELFYNGMSGEQIESEVFVGPTYYMRLKHMVKDKINYRAHGPVSALTKQPVGGRANDGGLRIGEMERDSVISHGITEFLRESMMERGDHYRIAVCNRTGMLAIYNPAKNLFFSPAADGPVSFVGALDGTSLNIENVTRFGRDFSVVRVPYSFKLLIQELQTINIQMRIITDDNIGQFEHLAGSDNAKLLLARTGATPETIVEIVKKSLRAPGVAGLLARPKEDVSDVFDAPIGTEDVEAGAPKKIVMVRRKKPTTGGDGRRELEEYEPLEGGAKIESAADQETGVSSIPLWNKDDMVFLRGDDKPARMWRIISPGLVFQTIITEDMEGLDNELHATRVVNSNQIYPPVAEVLMQAGAVDASAEVEQLPSLVGGAEPETMPSIVFSPVIKVVNGDDNSSSAAPPDIPAVAVGQPSSAGGDNNSKRVDRPTEASAELDSAPLVAAVQVRKLA